MSDFSELAAQRAAELARVTRLNLAWGRACRFDADGLRGLVSELDTQGLFGRLGPVAESRRAALDNGHVFADAELAVIALLRLAAEGTDAELADAIATARGLWPDLDRAMANVSVYLDKPQAQPKHVAEPAAREPEPKPAVEPAEADGKVWLARAMLLVRDNPKWSDAKIAKAVGKSASSLCRSREYRAAAKLAREPRTEPRRGHVTVDSDNRRNVEAYDLDGDPAERDWDD